MYRHNALPSKIQNQIKKRTNYIVNKQLNELVMISKNIQLQSCKNSHSSTGNYFFNPKYHKQKSKSNSLHRIHSKQKPKSVKSPQKKQKTLNSTMMLSTIQKVNTNTEGSKFIKLEDMIKDQRRIRQVAQFNQNSNFQTKYQKSNINFIQDESEEEIQKIIVGKVYNKFKRQFSQYKEINIRMYENFDQVFLKELWQSYEGQLDDNGKRNGYGILKICEGSKFSGYFIDDKICGDGTFESSQNFTIMGIWHNNYLFQQILNAQMVPYNNNFK